MRPVRLPRLPLLHARRPKPIDGHDITCRQVVGLVTDYLDGNLTPGEHALFEAHLSECEDCTEHVKQIQVTVAIAGSLRDEDVDSLAREDLVNLYRRWRTDLHA
jgi:anti-sigma factor RsiW